MDGARLNESGQGNAMRRKSSAAPSSYRVRATLSTYQKDKPLMDKELAVLGSRHAWPSSSLLDDLDLPYTIETHEEPGLHERRQSSASASTASPPRRNGGRKQNQTRRHEAHQMSTCLRLTDRQLTSYIKNCHDLPELHALWRDYAASLNSMHVAAFLHRLGKCHNASNPVNLGLTRDMLSHLDASFLLHLDSYSAREVSMALWSWGTLSHKPPPHVWAAVLCAIGQKGADAGRSGLSRLLASATPQSIAMLAWGMFKIGGRSQQETVTTLDDISSLEDDKAIGNQPTDEESLAWDSIAVASRLRICSLPARDLANITWAFASAGRHDVSFFNLMADTSIALINDFTPQDLSNTAWAFAVLRHPYKPLFEAIAGASSRILHAFSPQAIANLIWAFAVVRIDHAEELMEVASKESMRRLESFLPAHLSMMAWALARSGGRSGSRSSGSTSQCLSSIANITSTRLPSFKSKEISLILWSLSWAKGNEDNALFEAAPLELVSRLKRKSLSWQDMAHVLWSFSTAEHYDTRLFCSIADSCLSSSQLSPGLISHPAALDTIISSLATSGHYDQRLFSAAASALSRSVVCVKGAVWEADWCRGELCLNPAQATSILRALALMDHVDTGACDSVVSGLLSCISHRSLSSHDPSTTLLHNSCLVSCLMSLAVMNHTSFDLDLLVLVVKHVKTTVAIHRQAAQQEGLDTNHEMKRQRFQETLQLLQAVSWLEDQVRAAHLKSPSAISLHRAKEIQQILDELPRGLVERARESWKKGAMSVQRISKLQQGVNATLNAMGLRPRMESMTKDGMFSVDIVVPRWRSRTDVAVEVNGPYHYARVGDGAHHTLRPMGPKVLRDRFLRSRGLTVANISWLQWEEVDGDPAKMRAVLETALDKAIKCR